MRQLALAGLIALCFGLGSYYATGEYGVFGRLNLVLGGLALAAPAVAGARRLRGLGNPVSRRILLPRLLGIVGVAAACVLLERAAAWSGVQFDWTVEQRFSLSPAMQRALAGLDEELTLALYYERFDPRVRSTRILLPIKRIQNDKQEILRARGGRDRTRRIVKCRRVGVLGRIRFASAED